MSVPLQKSPFSTPFNTLYYLGAWASKPLGPRKLVFYFFYQVFVTFLSLCGILFLIFDLYSVSNSFDKITWNLCISTLFAGGVYKNINLYTHHKIIVGMRMELHNDQALRTDPEYHEIDQGADREYRIIRICFYSIFGVMVPFWLGARYHSSITGVKELPVPLRLPIKFDPDDDVTFTYMFALVGLGAMLGLVFVIETETVMHGFMVQISREYDVLLLDISKLNVLYGSPDDESEQNTWKYSNEFNESLRRAEAKMLLRKFAVRQQKLVEYSKNFETCYSKLMLIEIFAVSVIILFSAIQCLLMSETSFYDFSYQLGYLVSIVFHTFVVCWLANRITDQCQDVGLALYYTNWYLMDISLQKDMLLIMLRSQNPPRLTAGKAMDLNVNAFMNVMKNIYSWVTLFRQLELR